MNKINQKGFTLTEMLIVTAILAILAAIAIPAYQDYIERTRLVDAKQIMLNTKQEYEATRLSRPNDYSDKARAESLIRQFIDKKMVNSSAKGFYNIRPHIEGTGNNAYMVMSAVPVDSQKRGLYMDYRGTVYKCAKGTAGIGAKGAKPASCGTEKF